jgi:hypothetical protein
MNTGKAIFYGLALIALAIFARDVMRPANAGLMGGGRYMAFADAANGHVIVDTDTGARKFCWQQKCGPWVKP